LGGFLLWAIVDFGWFIETDRSSTPFVLLFPHGNGYVLIFTKHGLGDILGDILGEFFYKLIWSP
jgi:hypothetical protein